MVNCEIQYIPILQTLDYILKNSRFCSEITYSKSNDNVIRNFTDGLRYQQMSLWSSSGLPIQIKLYQDDIEVANALGANSGIYKLTMYYFTIMNLPPQYHALLSHHHLVCVAMASDVKVLGHNSVTKFMVEELSLLEHGVFMNGVNVFGTLVALAGDNLGLNGIIGMVESFSATYYCRFCMLQKSSCQENISCRCANQARRTEELHSQHVEELDYRKTGVARTCVLDQLTHFKAISSFTPDIMHDILEGIVKLEMTLILESIITQKLLSLEDINQYMDTFDYGCNDSKNQPRLLARSNGQITIRQSASRMWCFLRSLPVMIGEFIPDSCEEWELLGLLTEITGLAFRPTHSRASTKYLDYLVEEHHILFLKLFPNNKLTPKQHNLCHYGEASRLNGALTQFLAMRSEAKHQLAKITSGLSCNYMNIPLTVARKYQIVSFGDWRQNNIFPENSIERSNLDKVTALTINGSRFVTGCVVISEKTAYKLASISVDSNADPTIMGTQLDAVWNPNIMAYDISESLQQIMKVITPSMLSEYPHPICIWTTPSGARCIVPRYKITISSQFGRLIPLIYFNKTNKVFRALSR